MPLVTAIVLAVLSLTRFQGAPAQGVETELDGVTASVVELRQAGGLLHLAVRFTNKGAKEADPNRFPIERITLVDVKSKKKYFPLKDANGEYLAGPLGDRIGGGRVRLLIPARQSTVVWAYFEPVAAGTMMNVEMPFVFPFENVAVTEGAGTLLSSTATKSTPSGATVAVVSAKRGDQVVNVRLRMQAEPKTDPALGGSYFEYREVFLFDPVEKRKYPMVKDTEGHFQGQPLTVRGNGGSFILNWGKPTLISLTFQAPPDSVTKADLLLPRFLPVEGIALEGLGGAAAGGVAAAGKELGLEGALKELGAEVTAKEIKIDLAADVLFDFDKSTIKKEAEPSLRNVATVLKANPGAAVMIEGHTDAKGADAYNQTLSEQRAAAVKQWLVANAQLSGSGIATSGWGKQKPVAPNTNADGSDAPEGRAKNRRVQITVRKGA
jgi:outer membrane protein OmpA-like peptidoglycan-associated protein